MPRSSQVPPFAQGLRKQGEGAARSQGHSHPSLSCMLASRLHWGAPACASLAGACLGSGRVASTIPISQCRPEKPGGQSHLYLPM